MTTPYPPRGGRRDRYPLEEPRTTDLVREVTRDLREIVRLEIELARAELQESLLDARQAAIFGGVAGVLLALGAILLPFSAAWALGLVMPLWAAFLIVGAVLLLAGGGFALAARNRMRRVELTPHHTLDTLRALREDTWT